MRPETELKPLRVAFYLAMEDGEPLRVIISGEAGWPSPACGMCLTPAPSALPAGQAAGATGAGSLQTRAVPGGASPIVRPEPPSRVLLRECVAGTMSEKKDWLCRDTSECEGRHICPHTRRLRRSQRLMALDMWSIHYPYPSPRRSSRPLRRSSRPLRENLVPGYALGFHAFARPVIIRASRLVQLLCDWRFNVS